MHNAVCTTGIQPVLLGIKEEDLVPYIINRGPTWSSFNKSEFMPLLYYLDRRTEETWVDSKYRLYLNILIE